MGKSATVDNFNQTSRRSQTAPPRPLDEENDEYECVSEENHSIPDLQEYQRDVVVSSVRQNNPYSFNVIPEYERYVYESPMTTVYKDSFDDYVDYDYGAYDYYYSSYVPSPAPAPFPHYSASGPCHCNQCEPSITPAIPIEEHAPVIEKEQKVVRPSRSKGTAATHSVACCYHKQGLTCKMGNDCWYRHDDPSDESLRETPCHYGAKCLAGHAQYANKPKEAPRPVQIPVVPPVPVAHPRQNPLVLNEDLPCAFCGMSGQVYTQSFPLYTNGRRTISTRGHCKACYSTFAI